MSATMWVGAVLLVVGCGSSHGAPSPVGMEDASLPVLDGAQLRVEQAWWNTPQELVVATAVENRGSAPLAGHATSFDLEDADGRQVRGRASGRGDCARGAVIEPGATARCVVHFETRGQPRTLRHPSGEAPVEACGEEAPFGLCPLGAVCVGGACREECSATHQDGACVNEDSVCQAGVCVTSCSDSPLSGCEEGACVDGVCELACYGLALRDDGCWGCLWDLLDAGACEVDEACRDCADCVGGRLPGEEAQTTCDCLADEVCDGCHTQGRDYWSCLTRACPACSE